MSITGRCLCGSVRYHSEASPQSMTYCHWDDCRRMTGSAFNVGVGIPPEELHVCGEIRRYSLENDHGRVREFCPACGSPLFTRYPHMVFIKAGTIDNCEFLKPTRQIWTEMAVPWSEIPADIESYVQGGRATKLEREVGC